MDDPKAEAIKMEMAKTRLRIADKLETLEEQVVEPAAVAVSDTVAKVKEAVDTTAEAVQSTVHKVQETFDLAAHVKKYPYRMMAAGVASGFILAHLLRPAPPPASRKAEASAPRGNGEPIGVAHSNGVAKTMNLGQQARSDHGTLGYWATEVSSAVMKSLAPVWKGLFGAAIAQLLDHSVGHRSAEKSPQAKGFAGGEWTSPNSQPEQEWGGRLRSGS